VSGGATFADTSRSGRTDGVAVRVASRSRGFAKETPPNGGDGNRYELYKSDLEC
jgi:hypothetical protein